MQNAPSFIRLIVGTTLLVLWVTTAASAHSTAEATTAPPQTMRVDYIHSGGPDGEHFGLDRVVIEPLPWPGPLTRTIDQLELGPYRFIVRDASSKTRHYSRGFGSIYGEWETTTEARELNRSFHESLRFPRPPAAVEVTVEKRRPDQQFQPVWTVTVDPDDMLVDQSTPANQTVVAIQETGPPANKVDLLMIGDGYTANECPGFIDQAQRLTETLFRYEPFRERRQDFNVWAICPPGHESGVSRPSTGVYHRSPVGARYDIFRSERYVLTLENRALRDIAAHAPYEMLSILVNSETYGGGGVFGQHATLAAGNDWAEYLFVHEFAHHFAALADEYYTSAVAYEPGPINVEPWERNITALLDGPLKWQAQATTGIPVPTPWPKEVYEKQARLIQAERQRLRAANRPEAEMSTLFRRQQKEEGALFDAAVHHHDVGAFEGAGYRASGYFRPQIDCVMFSRNDVPFCDVCIEALGEVIDLYAPP